MASGTVIATATDTVTFNVMVMVNATVMDMDALWGMAMLVPVLRI